MKTTVDVLIAFVEREQHDLPCKRLARITRAELIKGMLIGVFLFAGYALQTNGLRYTTVSKAGFITGLNVPLVAVFSFLFLRQKPTLGAIAGMLLSLLGLCLLSIDSQFNFAFGLGELLILGCAFAFALQIVGISKFVSRADAINLAIVQLALTSLLSFLALPLAGEPIAMPPLLAWGSVVFMGVIDMAFCIFAMNWVQQYLSSTRAALIYALEPVWAGVFGVLLAGDRLSVAAWMGCVCIFLGMVISELRLAHVMKLLSR